MTRLWEIYLFIGFKSCPSPQRPPKGNYVSIVICANTGVVRGNTSGWISDKPSELCVPVWLTVPALPFQIP